MNDNVMNWLLEDDIPAAKYRTQTELLDISKDSEKVKIDLYITNY